MIREARASDLPKIRDVEAAAGEAFRLVGMDAIANVPWNAPYYARLGFRKVPESEWPDGMGQMVQEEAAHGLDDWPRVVMKLEFPAK